MVDPDPDSRAGLSRLNGPQAYPWQMTADAKGNLWSSNPSPTPGGRVNLTDHGLTGLVGSGLTGDLQSLLGAVGHSSCPAPPPGTFDDGQ
jgi:hypothetical protein